MTNVAIICGFAGTGKTVTAAAIAKKLNYQHINPGDIVKSNAKTAGMPGTKFLEHLLKNPELDRQFDEMIVQRAREGRVVIESRILPWILPVNTSAYCVWLTCNFEVRIERVCKRVGREVSKQRIHKRETLDFSRWKNLYGITFEEFSPFDLIVDTTNIPSDVVVGRILEHASKNKIIFD